MSLQLGRKAVRAWSQSYSCVCHQLTGALEMHRLQHPLNAMLTGLAVIATVVWQVRRR